MKMNKKNLKNLLFSLLWIFIFFSCSDGQEKKDYFDLLSKPSIAIEGELIDPDMMAYKSSQMKFIQSKLFHFGPTKEDACLVTTEKMDTLGYLSGIGGGPGEMLQPFYCGVSINQDTIYMFDNMYKELFAFHFNVNDNKINDTFVWKKSPNTYKLKYKEQNMNQMYFFLKRLENGYYIGYRLLTGEDIFTLFDKDLNAMTNFGKYPMDKNLFEGDLRATSFFWGPMETYGNSFYYGSAHFGYISRYDISDQGEITEVWTKQFTKPEYTMENNKVKFSSNSIESFYQLTIGKEYIYATFSGVENGELLKTQNNDALTPQILVILDKEGNIKGKFDLGKKIRTLCLDEKEEYLYVNHKEPDTSLWRYKVSDFLNIGVR